LAYAIKFIAYCELEGSIADMYADIHGSDKGEYPEKLWREFKGSFRWTVMTVGDYLELRPGAIHLVVSPVNSVMTGWMHVLEDWIEDGTLKQMMLLEVDVIRRKVEAARYHHIDLVSCVMICCEVLSFIKGGKLAELLQMQLSTLIKEVEVKIL
jgi:hypothetical protein